MKQTVTVGEETKELTQEQYTKLQELLNMQQESIEAFQELEGKNIVVRTITMIYTGHIEWIKGKWMKLSTATWVADTGRFADFMKGKPTSSVEYEPMGTTILNTDTFLDISLIKMDLPFEQK